MKAVSLENATFNRLEAGANDLNRSTHASFIAHLTQCHEANDHHGNVRVRQLFAAVHGQRAALGPPENGPRVHRGRVNHPRQFDDYNGRKELRRAAPAFRQASHQMHANLLEMRQNLQLTRHIERSPAIELRPIAHLQVPVRWLQQGNA